jgi:SnoaL-like polyketide cyclase.
MDAARTDRAAAFGRLIDVWSNGDPADILGLITADYVGHMLHLEQGQRLAQDYPGWIKSFREANPNTRFLVQDQSASGDRLWTRLRATRGDGAVSHGMNVSRFVGDILAEEWAVWSGWMLGAD